VKKSVLSIVFLFALGLSFVACAGGSSRISEVINTLEADGYELEERDEDSREYYQANMVNDMYDLDVDVIELYVGYVDDTERWAEIVVLENDAQATEFYDKLMIEATQGRYVLKMENVVILTFSQETSNLFTYKG